MVTIHARFYRWGDPNFSLCTKEQTCIVIEICLECLNKLVLLCFLYDSLRPGIQEKRAQLGNWNDKSNLGNEQSKFLLRKDCNVTQLKMPLAGCVSFYVFEVKSFAIKCKDEVGTKQNCY